MYYKLEDIKGVDRNRYSKDIQYGHKANSLNE